MARRIPVRFGLDPIRDVQVLGPMNRGGLGAGWPRTPSMVCSAPPPADGFRPITPTKEPSLKKKTMR